MYFGFILYTLKFSFISVIQEYTKNAYVNNECFFAITMLTFLQKKRSRIITKLHNNNTNNIIYFKKITRLREFLPGNENCSSATVAVRALVQWVEITHCAWDTLYTYFTKIDRVNTFSCKHQAIFPSSRYFMAIEINYNSPYVWIDRQMFLWFRSKIFKMID